MAVTETGYETIPDSLWWTQTLMPVIENIRSVMCWYGEMLVKKKITTMLLIQDIRRLPIL